MLIIARLIVHKEMAGAVGAEAALLSAVAFAPAGIKRDMLHKSAAVFLAGVDLPIHDERAVQVVVQAEIERVGNAWREPELGVGRGFAVVEQLAGIGEKFFEVCELCLRRAEQDALGDVLPVFGEQRGQRDAHAEDALGRDVQGPDKRVNMRAELLIVFAAVAVVFRDSPALEDVSIHVDGDEAQMVRGDVYADGDFIHADTAVCNALSSARGLEISAALDEVFLFEQLEILRDRGQAQMERVGDLLPGAAFVEIDMVENLAPVIAAHGFGCDFLHGDPPLRETRYRYACEAAVDWSRCAQIY